MNKFLILLVIFLVSCAKDKVPPNDTSEQVVAQTFVADEFENNESETLSADEVVSLYESENNEMSVDLALELVLGELATNPIYRDESLLSYIEYMTMRFDIDVRCDKDINERECFFAVENLVKASQFEDFPQNPSIVPVEEIVVSKLEEQVFGHYVGLDEKVYVEASPEIDVEGWKLALNEAIASPERLEIVSSTLELNTILADLGSYFRTSITQYNRLEDSEFSKGLTLLEQVKNLDTQMREPNEVLVSENVIDISNSIGSKAYQKIVIGNENKRIYENNGLINVMVDAQDTPQNIYIHLLTQPNAFIFSLNRFQRRFLITRGVRLEMNELREFENSAKLASDIRELQKNVDTISNEIQNLTGIELKCDLEKDRKRLFFLRAGLTLEECHSALNKLSSEIENLSVLRERSIEDCNTSSFLRMSSKLNCRLVLLLSDNYQSDYEVVLAKDGTSLDVEEGILFLNHRLHRRYDLPIVSMLIEDAER